MGYFSEEGVKPMGLSGKWKIVLAVLLAVLVVGGGVAAWYYGYYTKTPEYAVKMIETSAKAHDLTKFERYVDVRKISEKTGEEFLEGVMDADHAMTDETRSAVSSFAEIFKASVTKSFEDGIREYVRKGEWGGLSPDAQLLLDKSGLYQAEPRGIEGLEKNAEDGKATLDFRVYQKEAGEEFLLKIRLVKDQEGLWRAEEVENFREFIAFVMKARKEQFRKYLKTTEDILRGHDEKVNAADKKLVDILHSGSMGDMNVRRQMRAVMAEEILPDWQLRRSELEAVEAPMAAQALHRLRLRICDMRIAYAIRYAEWLETKKAGDIQEANEILKEARTLEQEAETMTRRMTRGTM